LRRELGMFPSLDGVVGACLSMQPVLMGGVRGSVRALVGSGAVGGMETLRVRSGGVANGGCWAGDIMGRGLGEDCCECAMETRRHGVVWIGWVGGVDGCSAS